MAPDERPVVSALGANGTRLGSVRAAVAANGSERFTGLSETESLGDDEGMLFVYDDVGTRTFVMRDMDFPLDIVFADANGAVTAIHHAPVPPEGTNESELTGYEGTGQYVLEVNRGWTNETSLDVGDRICFPVNQ
ncbi:DUF192 domain-containing protein [Halobacteria archaeon HArc-gm2]|nr:DUF192 domain-containing protein [Halobacteria archaeon HArc-gm2]